MKNKSIFQQIIQYLVSLTFIIWLVSYVCRHLLVYQMFEPRELQLRSFFSVDSLKYVFEIILPILVTNIISYSIFLVLFIIFIATTDLKLKNEGWLFITLLVVLVTGPFEIFLLTKDYSIISLIYNGSQDYSMILELIRKRITILSSFSLIEIFAYFAVIYLIIAKPLVKKDEIKRERT